MNKRLWIPQQNIVDVCTEYARISDSAVIDHKGLYKTFCTPGFFYSRNVLEHITQGDLRPCLDQIIADSKNGSPALTTFTEELVPEGTKEAFADRGFSLMLSQHGMIFEAGTAFDKKADPHITRLYAEDVSRWVDTMMLGFAHEKEREDIPYERMINSPDLYFLAFMEDGQILGTTILHLVEGYSGLHEVSVDPAFQGRGIATKLVTHTLQLIDKAGTGGAALQASDMGRPVYERLGFVKVSNIHSMLRS